MSYKYKDKDFFKSHIAVDNEFNSESENCISNAFATTSMMNLLPANQINIYTYNFAFPSDRKRHKFSFEFNKRYSTPPVVLYSLSFDNLISNYDVGVSVVNTNSYVDISTTGIDVTISSEFYKSVRNFLMTMTCVVIGV